MSRYFHQLLTLAAIAAISLQSCTDKCESTTTYIRYEPVYTSFADLRSQVDLIEPQPINQSGKIYYINEHLLINEPNEGIHIIDNSDPANPINKAFINIPGNFDMAAVDGYLYADSYMDLVVFDISDIANPSEINRVENVFPNYNSHGFYADASVGVVTDWVKAEGTDFYESDCEGFSGGVVDEALVLRSDVAFNTAEAVSPSNPGIGGSMARFTINNEHLYIIDQSQMYVADITNPSSPVMSNTLNVRWGIETIFPYDSLIFIGANDGMSIYNVSTPKEPEHLSTYNHVTSCDPVVTDGKYAYVTLRSGTECAGFTNQLEVLDIQNPRNPRLLETYPMHNPHGLSINDQKLYICDGDDGLKVFDASDISTIDQNLLKHYDDIHAYDVIVIDCLIMLIGNDGLHQYSCTDFQDDIKFLSSIPFTGNN